MCTFAQKYVMALDIKRVIKKKGLTVQGVADNMGITRVGLSQHINGNPSVDVLERIAKAIGCDVADFFEKPKEPTFFCPHCGKEIHIKIE